MRIVDLITKKRDHYSLTDHELVQLIDDYTNDRIPDYQMAAFLMAVYLNGMSYQETAALTLAMANSGATIDLSGIPGIKVDKHSTGGVADTTTLILAPLVAAAGVPVAKMSGRGLGFTGGTIDKLESIPGFRTTLAHHEFIANVKRHQLAITGQSIDVAPADGKIYALRDVTATVESIPLIASSIMSKKIAAGADKILLDVKVGSGAFMKDLGAAVELAETMVKIGEIVGRDTKAILTSMEEPLGLAIGNSLEVKEAIDVLSGSYQGDLREVCLILGSHMLQLAGVAQDVKAGYQVLQQLLDQGIALKKFTEFIQAQGGISKVTDQPDLMPQATYCEDIVSLATGYVQKIDVAKVGYIATILGAGREYKGQSIDLTAGILMRCRIGDFIRDNQPLATFYGNDYGKFTEASKLLQQSIIIGNTAVTKPKLILGFVDKNGFTQI
jgi:pyrimidine-nucleoside phosphorylase